MLSDWCVTQAVIPKKDVRKTLSRWDNTLSLLISTSCKWKKSEDWEKVSCGKDWGKIFVFLKFMSMCANFGLGIILLAKVRFPGVMVIRFCFWLAHPAPVNIMSQQCSLDWHCLSIAIAQNRAAGIMTEHCKIHKKETDVNGRWRERIFKIVIIGNRTENMHV